MSVTSSQYAAMVAGGWQITFTSVLSPSLNATFRSALTSFEDDFKSEWQRDTSYGRNDHIQSFQGTQRTISFGWQLAAASLDEAKENMIQLSTLIKMLYPRYDASAGTGHIPAINGAPFIKIKFANLINDAKTAGPSAGVGLVGTLDGIAFNPDMEAGVFPGLDPASGKADANLYPKIINLDCTFHPVHSHAVGVDTAAALGFSTPGFPYGQIQVAAAAAQSAAAEQAANSVGSDPVPLTALETAIREGRLVERPKTPTRESGKGNKARDMVAESILIPQLPGHSRGKF